MNVTVALNERLSCTPDGKLWSESSFGYASLKRYLEVFERVRLVARVCDVGTVDGERQRVDGPGVELLKVPYFVGPAQYLAKAARVKRVLKSAVKPGSAVILRMPAWHTTGILAERLQQLRYPYAIEVCGDPYDRLAPGASHHPLRPLLRWWLTRRTRQVCRAAEAALYVTDKALQRRYPAGPSAFSVGCSDVALPEAAFSDTPRKFVDQSKPRQLVFVGSLSQPYKAPDVLIQAVAQSIRAGQRLQLQLIGDGTLRPALEQLAARLGVTDEVTFVGQLKAGERIREALDGADLFVLPSRQEGLPRAMVEAMARGLPCVGSTVGGIPELLNAEDMVPPGDVTALSNKLAEVLADPARMNRMADRNWKRASNYRQQLLDERRAGFYQAIRERTDAFMAQGRASEFAGRATNLEKAA